MSSGAIKLSLAGYVGRAVPRWQGTSRCTITQATRAFGLAMATATWLTDLAATRALVFGDQCVAALA